MNKKERVMTALRCRVPDCVPYMYAFVDTELQEAIVGHALPDYRFDLRWDPGEIMSPGDPPRRHLNYCVHPETARRLDLDALGMRFTVPIFAEGRLERSGYVLAKGLLQAPEDLAQVRMPDPDDDALYRPAEAFVKAFGGEYAIYAQIRLGISPTLLGMGYEGFAYALADQPGFVREVVALYAEWNKRVIKNLIACGFDFLWSFDDVAFKTNSFCSPKALREVFIRGLKETARTITIPWIFHSDGNIRRILDDLLELGMSAIHPLEPGTMDLDELKASYGKKLCLVGNIDINHTLSTAPVEQVEREVRERIQQLGPGGGYIIADSNSVPYFCKPDNILAMADEVARHRNIY